MNLCCIVCVPICVLYVAILYAYIHMKTDCMIYVGWNRIRDYLSITCQAYTKDKTIY